MCLSKKKKKKLEKYQRDIAKILHRYRKDIRKKISQRYQKINPKNMRKILFTNIHVTAIQNWLDRSFFEKSNEVKFCNCVA